MIPIAFIIFWALRFVSGQNSYTKSEISYTKTSSRSNFVYEMTGPDGPEFQCKNRISSQNLMKQSGNRLHRRNQTNRIWSKNLRLQTGIRLGWENGQAADFVLTRIRHTEFPFVYENSASLGFRIRIPWISYTKSGFRIRNFHFVVRNRRRNSSPGPKIGTTRNIVYDFSSPKVDFVYEIHGFRIRNSYTKKSRLRLFVGGGDTI